MNDQAGYDPRAVEAMVAQERATYLARNPVSAARQGGTGNLFGGVPMTWLAKSAAPFPLHFEGAFGARVVDADGHELVDFCLGDTGAMAGHSPLPTVEAVARRYGTLGGATTMLLTEDAGVCGSILADRFGLPLWSFALTATDANRWSIRLARALTGRSKILVNSYSYHGSVDESFAVKGPDGAVSRRGNVGPPCDVARTTRVAEFNDLADLERELAHGDVAAVLMEPAMTNMGIVLPEPGYLAGVRALTRAAGTLLINDETHTLSAGPGGCTAAWRLEPDIVTLGKAIGGGIPSAAYGISQDVADRLAARPDLDLVDTGGVGGTLAGNALSLAAVRATLTEVLTPEAFVQMTALSTRYATGVEKIIRGAGLPWSISQLGARAEYRFTDPAPRNGTASEAATDLLLEDYLHLYLLNRGVLLTPFHNMALMCPATTEADVDLHLGLLGGAVDQLVGA
ncbi:aminotransferase class III-fold pyridoxal phosphate-dependent enzyme [Nocardioides marmoriginsengisoli]|uniref:Aminotransferase class III-fold pyridoxal phosphate-dependent enzyme n=1 Tax=Nocardioides marmoriginsengisoli TaxID=661483 RepID=A0A3N0CGE2_9ACTN|nr:transaminase [Nocardioides marmoriginsengisoli]RNL62505.1 aminotransferase class III-fold pyridoxal phosphate-dependent enzyme [Nocardioides marmoriginsengisoli]